MVMALVPFAKQQMSLSARYEHVGISLVAVYATNVIGVIKKGKLPILSVHSTRSKNLYCLSQFNSSVYMPLIILTS
jgi:hypothetical protein